MSTVLKSNKQYTGSSVLPNVIDFISTLSDKVAYLKKLYAAVGGDTTYITSSNADSIFTTLKTHRDRVISDGGIVLSMAHTLRAIIFAAKNSLLTADYSAFSPDFGVKINGLYVTKIYDIAGRDQPIFSGSFTKAIDSNLNVISATGISAFLLQSSPITASNGFIIGSSSHEPNGDTTSYVRAPAIFQNNAGTGTQLGVIENNYGNVARFSYLLDSGTPVALTYSQVGSAYIKYAGIVGLSIGGGASYLFENGVQKSTAETPSKNISGTALYPGVVMNSAGAALNESWIINSQSQSLAQSLSLHLNKSIFN